MAKVVSSNVSQTTYSNKNGGNSMGQGYFAALALVGAVIPIPFLSALITIFVYLSPSPFPDPNTLPIGLKQVFQVFIWLGAGNTVLLLGLMITFIVWLLIALPCRYFATAKGGRPSDYESLKREVDILMKQLKLVQEQEKDQASHTTGTSASATAQQKDAKQNITREQDKALEEKKARAFVISDIDADLDHINKRLDIEGLHWLSTGYVSIWDRVNKADEAMIDMLPRERVIESAKLDELCLINSGVPDSENLLKLLKKAIETLSSQKATGTASSDAKGPKSFSEQKLAQAMLALLKKAALPPIPSPPQSEQEARADVRQVKAALHDFTNKRWDGLVRARNVLLVTAFLTSVFVYILVAVAILANIENLAIERAIVFYILGAVVGLFKRLYDEKDTDNAVDDYGLTMTRIIVTPLLSGLAAVVGVFLVTFLSITITSQNASPSTTPVMIVDIYNFSKNPQNLVFAAIFGYVPNLVLSILQSKSEDIKGQIKSVSPTDNSETVSKGNGIGSTAKAKIGK